MYPLVANQCILLAGWREKLEDYLPELVFIAITHDDLDRARYHINQYYGKFLAKWASLHPLALSGRHLKLQSLQRIVEMEEFLDFVRYTSYCILKLPTT